VVRLNHGCQIIARRHLRTDLFLVEYRYLKVRELATGKVFDDDADVVIAAKGNLSDPAWPQIPGLKDFEGEVMHSARWKEE
jgi:cation diffusion facilitator CzcD-associated flavoprotein CzcO